MKELMCLAVFAGKVVCLTVFIAALKPEAIRVAQDSTKRVSCEVGCSPVQGFGQPGGLVAGTQADADSCRARPSTAGC